MAKQHATLTRIEVGQASAKQAAHEEALQTASVSLASAARLTGASVDRLRRLVARGEVVAFTTGGSIRVPLWQLQSSEVAPAIPGSAILARAFPGSLADLNYWIGRPHVDLVGDSPEAALKRGEGSRVLSLVRAIGAAGR
ncbi:MAG TPA: hypothetical protein VGO66_09095 [Solirubrobacterales bacterium]|jgi:hypothetical protein|nr:hypothetical protein [Solirubrobacterales bacterium]